MNDPLEALPSSFRDPSGFLFLDRGVLHRQVNRSYQEDFDLFIGSGLYNSLRDAELLIPHEEVALPRSKALDCYKILRPEPLTFVSYPFEWSFSQLKDAALTTLAIQKQSLDHGMSLKDGTAYNIQFRKGKPLLIDTLSFERYPEGKPWVAYRQFCQHFLAPLALASYSDVRLSQLLRIHLDGIPLDLASQLLPLHTRFRFSLLTHLHLHAKAQTHFADKPPRRNHRSVSRIALLGLIENLESCVRALSWSPPKIEWSGYYGSTNYSSEALRHKQQLVAEFLDQMSPKPRMVWDLGANTGLFSRLASNRGMETIAFDQDPACVDQNYRECKQRADHKLLPLWIDLTDPSPNLGWHSRERMSWLGRGSPDAVLALALIHHLAIANNLPLPKLAGFFGELCPSLIIEFVPKTDSQVRRLLASRKDVFPDYTPEAFEAAFRRYFEIRMVSKIRQTERILYRMERKARRNDCQPADVGRAVADEGS